MTSPASPQPPRRPHSGFPADPSGRYLPPGSGSDFPLEGPLYTPKPKRQLDRLVGIVITLMVILSVFALIVAMLTNISPGPPTELVPDEVAPRPESGFGEADQTIRGD
ncbi:DUF4044 domain-containing protein [Rubinisphaera sp. JC750]|uniref:Uncharacterized protein n=1 Tax=Rubinisphaera brasiliensis (strain ATCC 49424 / DSM 5305 / JCM 21570 / IAM 15109 / NBRC 103401 / IFAM 1448) TaxID=756272 RepID=F0SHR7_RUBBR|nr:DUF4044 domain-containing protein [Rubinisphaera sp. JC750]ADY59547.1 hypothetical protein Plabr_1938 [Rubinisphaera brasiliensis DSM 5305]